MNIDIETPNLICVCVNDCDGHDFSGEIYHRYSLTAVPFRCWGEMVLTMERLFDDIRYPQAAVMERQFRTARKEVKQMQDTEKVLNHRGELATFVVHVQYRQNATWQGKVVWADKNSESTFRSALELLKLMDAALETVEKDTQTEADDSTTP